VSLGRKAHPGVEGWRRRQWWRRWWWRSGQKMSYLVFCLSSAFFMLSGFSHSLFDLVQLFFFLFPLSLFFSKRFGQMERNTFASNVSPCSCIRVVLQEKEKWTMLGELIHLALEQCQLNCVHMNSISCSTQ
jgi:hypothetical protein